jgi:metallophosphoesterase (TIGR00282 family)
LTKDPNTVHVLMIGDVMGHPGLQAVREGIPRVRKSLPVDLVIANGENSAGGFGLTERGYHDLRDSGVDVITLGNHAWDKKEIFNFIDAADRIVRPANYPPGTPGRGWTIVTVGGVAIAVLQLMGRAFMNALDCPFQAADRELKALSKQARIVIVDMHAEATSEKIGLAHYLDGQVSAILGTHTHVQTADEQIFPRGTGYITDVGMSGPRHSVVGIKPELALRRIREQLPVRFEVADGPTVFSAVWLAIDKQTGRTTQIQRISYKESV